VSERAWRIITATAALSLALVVLTQWEQHRAVSPPAGWRVENQGTAPIEADIPRLGSSRWRVGDGVRWRAQDAAKETFLRAVIPTGATFTVITSDEATGVQLHLASGRIPHVTGPAGASANCDGVLPKVEKTEYPVVLRRTTGGVLISSEDSKLACAGTLDRPTLLATQGTVEIASLGQDGDSAGLPLAPSEWLAGVVVVGFFWMMLVELERARGVRWPVVILSGVPAWAGLAILYLAPSLTVWGDTRASIATVGLLGVCKLVALATARPAQRPAEE
jgi:hypothetical protein